MNYVALISAVTALLTAVSGLVALFKHSKSPHPVTPVNDSPSREMS